MQSAVPDRRWLFAVPDRPWLFSCTAELGDPHYFRNEVKKGIAAVEDLKRQERAETGNRVVGRERARAPSIRFVFERARSTIAIASPSIVTSRRPARSKHNVVATNELGGGLMEG